MALSITGKAMGSTSLDLKAGTITKTIPVSVRSTNLLAYGPASGNGLTVTVAADGSLDLASAEAIEIGKGVVWPVIDLTAYIGKTLTLGYEGNITALGDVIASLRKTEGTDGAGIYAGRNNQSFTVTAANAKALQLKIYKGGNNAGLMNGNLKIRLTEGENPPAWMRPDVTNNPGGA